MKHSSGPRKTASNLSDSIHCQLSLYALAVVAVSVLFLAPTALASSTWYVDGVNGSDSNNCKTRLHACKTIGHAISLAHSGDSIMVSAAVYRENVAIGFSLKIIGSGAKTTIIDGGGVNTVVAIPNPNAHVALLKVTIRNGRAAVGHCGFTLCVEGGGIYNSGTLSVIDSTISGNVAFLQEKSCYLYTLRPSCLALGGGIYNSVGTLTISKSTIMGNVANVSCLYNCFAAGGAILNGGSVTINNSTISGNNAFASSKYLSVSSFGGGISNSVSTNVTVNNSTISGNGALSSGGGIGGGISNSGGTAIFQNSIVANSTYGGNCSGTITSNGYNLSSDDTCSFNRTGDLNNTDPKLGRLQNNGGPTQTQALLSGSPAIDAGNPGGCTDGQGHLLKTDQRGKPRHDKEDTGGCDMGAYERQSD
jgi:hypothetical protein